MPASLPQQGPAPYTPNPQFPPYTPNPQYPAYTPYGQQYNNTPISYTDPQAYQPSSNGAIQQPQGYPYQGYYAPYSYQQRGYPAYPPGYPVYPYAWYPPPRPRRNGYQLGLAITSLVGSILAVIAGLFCGLALLGYATRAGLLTPKLFPSTILLTALMLAGIVGGALGILHSSFALAQRPSRPFKLPPFWFFVPIYIVLITVGLIVGSSDVIIKNLLLIFPLIALSGIIPALTFLALALGRLRRSETREWPTTWRRFTLALLSGATSAILLASIFELVLTLIAALQFIGVNPSFITDPNAPIPHNLQVVIFILTIYSVIAPIVEEGVKPLAVVTLIGRIRSASEAFILGMACGIGFDVIETIEYMGTGYRHWVDIAIARSSAGLLHGLGAGMIALGWYYITHKDALKRNHIQVGLGCMLYAILQHAIWNGSFVLVFLPAPIGPYLENGTISIFGYDLSAFLLVYLVFSVFMLWFLLFVTGKIRLQADAPLRRNGQGGNQSSQKAAKMTQMS
jgi:hypothetical protein